MDDRIFGLIFFLQGHGFWSDATILFFGRYIPVIITVGLVIIFLREREWRRRVFFFAEAGLAAILSRGILTEGIRFFYERPRPFEVLGIVPLIEESARSFPSGHMTFLFAIGTTLFFVNRKWGSWFLGLSFLTGIARIASGTHWPTDIVGGIVIGVISAFLIHLLVRPSAKKLDVIMQEQ